MNYRLSLPDHVLDQLVTIAQWYERESGSRETADNWYNGFLIALEGLRHNPESWSLIHETDPNLKDVRQLFYGSGKRKTHRALFRIVGDTVEILTVRHLSQRDVTLDDVS